MDKATRKRRRAAMVGHKPDMLHFPTGATPRHTTPERCGIVRFRLNGSGIVRCRSAAPAAGGPAALVERRKAMRRGCRGSQAQAFAALLKTVRLAALHRPSLWGETASSLGASARETANAWLFEI